MSEDFNILSKIVDVVISIISGMPLEHGSNLVKQKIEKAILEKKIRKREKYLVGKYKDNFNLLNKADMNALCEWLKEKRTIKRILSFSNAEDIENISIEQMRHSKENFFADAFRVAQIHNMCDKEELRIVLNDLLHYVDELFWKTFDEKDAFIYKKCILEIRQLVSEFTEQIIREIRYHGTFAEYIDSQKTLLEVPFKLDYRSEEIPFVGRTKEFKEIDAFCASEGQISWWAVVGKGGSGKSRLVYQYIKRNISSSEWKMCFLHDEFFNQVGGVGKYKLWNTWTYDKNLFLVVDYVQKYAKEVADWIKVLSRNDKITRKIRILFLERTDGEKALWIREGFEETELVSLKYKKGFLKLQSLGSDLIQFAIKYAEKRGKEIREEDAIDAWNKLKIIDTDARILYFIMLLEAVFDKEPWRNWNRIDLANHIVRREQKDIAVRFENKENVIRSFYRLLAFCTATKELPIFELPQDLPRLIKNEMKEISNNIGNKNKLCASMQLEEGILQPITPDIVGEYMVLHIIDQYFIYQEEKEEFIKTIWSYDSGNFLFFVYRLFQDKMDDGSFNNVLNLMLFDAVPKDNIQVTEDYAKLMCGLTAIGDLNQVHIFTDILERIYYDYPFNKNIAYLYANGLVNLSSIQDLLEREKTIKMLEYLFVVNADNVEIQIEYAKGLFNLSRKQVLSDIEETIGKLRYLAVEHADNVAIQIIYAYGLFNLASDQESVARKETIGKLEHLAVKHVDNAEIQTVYAESLFILSNKQKVSERRETIGKLEHLAMKHVDNVEIQTVYVKSLFNLINEQEVSERKETIGRIENLARQYADNIEIQIEYAKGLVNLSSEQLLPKIEETVEKLRILAVRHVDSADIQIAYANGLGHLSNKQELLGIKETIEKLEYLAVEHTDNMDIQIVYAKMLVTLCSRQELSERKETIVKLEYLSIKYVDNADIQTEYAKGLVNLCVVQGLVEIKETIRKLSSLAAEHADNIDIQVVYASGLLNLSGKQKQPEIKQTIEKLKHLAEKHADNVEVQTVYVRGLVNLSIRQEQPEIKETIREMWHLAVEYVDNIDIQVAYANGLLTLSSKQELLETKQTISKLEYLAVKYADNIEIQSIYASGLCNLSLKQEQPEIKETIGMLEHLAGEYVHNVIIHTAYARGLLYLSREQNQLEIEETIEKLKQLARKHSDNFEIQVIYTKVLADLIIDTNDIVLPLFF